METGFEDGYGGGALLARREIQNLRQNKRDHSSAVELAVYAIEKWRRISNPNPNPNPNPKPKPNPKPNPNPNPNPN